MHVARHLLDLGTYERGCHLQGASSQKRKTTVPRITGTCGEGECSGGHIGYKAFIFGVTFQRPKIIYTETHEPGLSCHLDLAEGIYNALSNL